MNKIEVNSENFFDVAEAIHCFCSINHDGQWSDLYSILSRSEFKPGPMWSESRVIEENEVYPLLTEENVSQAFDDLQKFTRKGELKWELFWNTN